MCWLRKLHLIHKKLHLFFHLKSINGFASLTHNTGIWSALLSKGHIVNSWTLIFSLISHRAVTMQGSLLKAPVLGSNNGPHFHPGYTPGGTPSLQAFHSRVSSCRRCQWKLAAAFWTWPVSMCSLTGGVCFWKRSALRRLLKLLSVYMIIKQQQGLTHWLFF